MTMQADMARHNALASNIANVNTPDYHRVDLSTDFKSSLAAALHQVDQGSQLDAFPTPQIVTAAEQNPARFDGNTVNIDQEMTGLIKNETDFDFAARMTALHYTGIKDAISGNV
jgi:flagellar basal-body rod protein FlgB